MASLRSRGCFILLDDDKAIIWMGLGLPEHKKAVVEALKQHWPELATGMTFISHQVEGQESESFRNALDFGAAGEKSYHDNLRVPEASIRLYKMTSVSGEFHVNEVVCPYLNEALPNVMSFNQDDLYKAEQPGMHSTL